MDSVDTMQRAILVFQREVAGTPFFRQKSGGSHRRNGCGSFLECGRKPVAPMQSRQSSSYAAADLPTPAAACYKSRGFDAVDVLNGFLGKSSMTLAVYSGNVAHNCLSSVESHVLHDNMSWRRLVRYVTHGSERRSRGG